MDGWMDVKAMDVKAILRIDYCKNSGWVGEWMRGKAIVRTEIT